MSRRVLIDLDMLDFHSDIEYTSTEILKEISNVAHLTNEASKCDWEGDALCNEICYLCELPTPIEDQKGCYKEGECLYHTEIKKVIKKAQAQAKEDERKRIEESLKEDVDFCLNHGDFFSGCIEGLGFAISAVKGGGEYD